ncbi:hypothetical protein LINGRAHAP2_LOCUS24957 [Linum grandiflorum]
MNSSSDCKTKLSTFATNAKAPFFASNFPNPKIIAVYILSSFSTFFLGIAMVFEWAFHGRSYPGCQWTIFYAVSLILLPLLCLLLCFLSTRIFRRRRQTHAPTPTMTPTQQQEMESVSIEEGAETYVVSSEQSEQSVSRDQRNGGQVSNEKEFIVCATCASRLASHDGENSLKGEGKAAMDDCKLRTIDELGVSPIEFKKTEEGEARIKGDKSCSKEEEFAVSSPFEVIETRASDLSQEEEIIVYLKGLSKRWENVRCHHYGPIISRKEEIPDALFGVTKTGDL